MRTIFILLASCVIVFLNSANTVECLSKLSKINRLELEHINYEMEILRTLREDTPYPSEETPHNSAEAASFASSLSNRIRLKSVYGQMYECYMPDLTSALQGLGEYDDDDEENELASSMSSDDDDSGIRSISNFDPSSFFDMSASPSKQARQQQYNFTLINEKITGQMDEFKRSKFCSYRNLGWWTYEFCPGEYICQYHQMANGSVTGEKISLGNFTKNFNWLELNASSELPMSASGVFYHEQYYEAGSVCEENHQPRRTLVKVFCDEAAIEPQIDLITELELCVYEMHVMTSAVCKIPSFSKKPNNMNINCNPLVSPAVYAKYIKREDARIERETESALQDFLKSKENEAKKVKDEEESATNPTVTLDSSFSLSPKTPSPSNVAESELRGGVGDVSDDELAIEILADDLLAQDEYLEHQESLEFLAKSEKLDSLNEQLKTDLAETEETIRALRENAKKFQEIVGQAKSSAKNTAALDSDKTQEQITAAHNVLASSVEKVNKNDELFNKLTQHLNEIIDEFEGQGAAGQAAANQQANPNVEYNGNVKMGGDKFTTGSEKALDQFEEQRVRDATGDPNKWKMKVSMIDSNVNNEQKAVGVDGDDDYESPESERIRELERTLADRLAKSDKLVDKLKTNRIKVKIITADNVDSEQLKQLSEAESEGLSALIASLFENDQHKQQAKRLKANYMQVYTEESLSEELAATGEEDDELFNVNDNEFFMDPIEDEKDKELIVY